MSADWCRAMEDRLGRLETQLAAIQDDQRTLIKAVVLGLLAIVGAVVGVKVLP